MPIIVTRGAHGKKTAKRLFGNNFHDVVAGKRHRPASTNKRTPEAKAYKFRGTPLHFSQRQLGKKAMLTLSQSECVRFLFSDRFLQRPIIHEDQFNLILKVTNDEIHLLRKMLEAAVNESEDRRHGTKYDSSDDDSDSSDDSDRSSSDSDRSSSGSSDSDSDGSSDSDSDSSRKKRSRRHRKKSKSRGRKERGLEASLVNTRAPILGKQPTIRLVRDKIEYNLFKDGVKYQFSDDELPHDLGAKLRTRIIITDDCKQDDHVLVRLAHAWYGAVLYSQQHGLYTHLSFANGDYAAITLLDCDGAFDGGYGFPMKKFSWNYTIAFKRVMLEILRRTCESVLQKQWNTHPQALLTRATCEDMETGRFPHDSETYYTMVKNATAVRGAFGRSPSSQREKRGHSSSAALNIFGPDQIA